MFENGLFITLVYYGTDTILNIPVIFEPMRQYIPYLQPVFRMCHVHNHNATARKFT
jgi:hypothetical protein